MNNLEANKINTPGRMDGKEGLHALFEFATEGILITDEKGEIVKINPSAEKLFGYEPGELLNKKIETLVPQRFVKPHQEHRHDYKEHPRPRAMGAGLQLFGKTKDNREIPVEISLSPYSSASGKFVIAFITDVTQRRKAEEQLKVHSQELEKEVYNRTNVLRETITELEKTKEELHKIIRKERELSEMKSRFVSMASHEFRTPLATILSSLSLVNKYTEMAEEEKRSKHINRIRSAISNMTEILNDFLSVDKLEEGQVQFNATDFDITSLAEEVKQEMQMTAKAGQKIVYIHNGNSAQVKLDKKILKNILLNLMSNAIKFSEEGKEIELMTTVQNGEHKKSSIVLTVKDHGIGIPDEDQKYLFTRFFRAHNSMNIQGTGLGLNIVKKYLELMDGSIKVASELNKGTTVTIKIPIINS